MAEKLKFVELDIDIEKLVNSSAKSLRHLQGLEEQQKNLKKSTKDLRKDMADIREAMNNPEIQKNTAEYAKLQNKLGETHKQYVQTSESLSKVQTGLKAARKEYSQNNKVLDAYAEKQRTQITVIKQTDGSINQISIALSKNKEAYKSLTKEERENSEIGQKLLKLIQDQDKEYKELNNSIGNTGVNVGNYKEEMKEAIEESLSLDKTLSGLLGRFSFLAKPIIISYNALKGYVVGQKSANVATNATSKGLKLFRLALISTGIGAIVILLISFITWLSKTQAGIDFVSKAMAGVGAFTDVIIDRFSSLAEAFKKLLTLDFVGFFTDGKKALSGIGDEMIRETKLAIALEEELQKLERRQIATSVARSEINKQIKIQNKLAEDTTKTDEERIKAINKAIELEKNQIAIENNLANDRLKNALQLGGSYDENVDKINEVRQAFIDSQGDNEAFEKTLRNIGLSKTLDKDIKAIGDAIIEQNAKITASEEALTTITNKKNTLETGIENKRKANFKASQDRAKKAIENAIAESKTLLDIYIAEQGFKAKTLQEELAIAESVSEKKKEILKAELKAGKITQSEYNLAILELDNDLASKRAGITTDIANRELQIFKDAHQAKLDANTFFTDELLQQETARLDAIAEKELEYHKKRLEQGVINQTQYNDAINTVNEENRIAKEEAQLLRDEAKKEKEIIDLENQRAIDEEQFQNQFAIQSERLEAQRLKEVEEAEKTGADKKIINDKYAAYQKSLDREIVEFKAEMNSQIFGGLKSLFGESSALGKLFAVGEIINNTVLNANKAFTQAAVFASNPLTAPLAVNANIQGGIIVATGAAQVAKTVAPKFEGGGLFKIKGKRHRSGGETFYDENGNPQFEGEDGELVGVMNRNASKMFMNFNNKFKDKSLGNGFSSNNNIVQRSFTTNTSNSAPIDYDLLASKIGEANLKLPPNKLSLEYLNSFQSDLKEVELGASR